MIRRICLAATVVGAAALVGAVAASAAPGGATHKPVVLNCKISMAIVPPPGSNAVPLPAQSGWQYGHSHCLRQGFRYSTVASRFNTADSGDLVGTYVDYFRAGTIKGKYDLTPTEQSLDNGFVPTAQAWSGTVTVIRGTGIYKTIKPAKHPGSLVCATQDGAHLVCTEKVRVTGVSH